MDYTEQRERDYQNQIIALFRDKLQYTYLGNFQYARGAKKNSFGKENSPLIEDEMRLFLKSQLNSNDNKQYTEMQIVEAVRQLRSTLRLPDGRPGTLVDINTDVYKLLIHGVKAKPSPDETERDVMFIDFVNTSNNRLCIAEEVSYIDPLTGSHSRPDLVVYINGIAVAVIELKRSLVSIEEAIKQQLSNQCDLIPSFFTTAQFTIAASDTNGFQYATINTPKDFWCAYKRDTNKTGVVLTDQEAFSEFFEKEQFLTFLRYGVLTDGGVKKVMRPHQFHALRAVIPRLKEKESGVIWHSQGSGKSLTMVWIAEYIRANFEDPRVLVITDRTELDKQIASNFTNAGNMLHRATSQEDLLNNLQSGTEWLICSLIHKFGRHKSGDKEVVGADNITIPLERYLRELKEMIASRYGRNFKAKGKNIFVFIDECHRTQGGRLHEAMRAIMGQDVMLIGFTGTPLLKKDKSSRYESFRNLTETRFGTFIHKYLLKQAVEDKVILDLQYENRDVDQQITDKTKLDQKLDEITSGLSDDRRKAVEDRWATLERIYSSTDRIERIGYSILDDMSNGILCNSWCNAMLVAGNIECAYKYYDFFQNRSTDTSLRGRCAVVTSYNPTDYDLRKATSNPVIEAAEKFKYSMAKQSFSDAGQQNAEQYEAWAKERFIKKPGQMKLLIVVDKLLTGFDAPCATYLYIDKDMRDHNLFQSICRVNRLGVDIKDEQGELVAVTHKEWGRIVDFKHLFKKISDAVTDFNDENGGLGGFDSIDIEGLLTDHIEKGKRRLIAAKEAYDSLKATWHGMNKEELLEYYVTDQEGSLAKERREVFYKISNALVIAYANISDYMGKAGFTQEESNDYHTIVDEARKLSLHIKQKSGDYFDPRDYDPNMRALFDRFIKADEAEVIIPASADFSFLDLIDNSTDSNSTVEKVIDESQGNEKSAAEIIEGKARAVINSYKDKDPEIYKSFSERLQTLLESMKKDSLDYVERMKKIIELIKIAKSGGTGYPEGVSTGLARALWNNLSQWCDTSDKSFALQKVQEIEEIVTYDAQDGWKNQSSPKYDAVIRNFKKVIPEASEEQLYNLYNLAAQNSR